MVKFCTFFALCFGLLFSDICSDLAKDLRVIFEKSSSIQGQFSRVIPFPNQGGSFINQIFLVESDRGEEFALKIENAKWQREKTLNEVKAIQFMKRDTFIPVPEVVAYEAALSQSTLGSEYILMKRLRGKPLNHEFARVYADKKTYLHVLKQLADILAALNRQKYTEIGSIDNKSPIDFAHLSYTTPCLSFSEYATRWLSHYIEEMRRLKENAHPNASYFAKHIVPLEELLNSPFIQRLDIPGEIFFLSHQDFVMKNILIDGETISGVLDWEWSGAAPREFEAKTGLDFLKTADDKCLFNQLLEERDVFHFFDPPLDERQDFYTLIGRVYALISCYEWIEGKLEHSAKFLDQKLEQRIVRADPNFDMQAYVEGVSADIESTLLLIKRRNYL